MQIFKKSTAWTLVLCLILGLALSVGPMAQTVSAEGYDPYVFHFGPDSSLVPAYYRDYAKRFVGWSSHMLEENNEGVQMVQMFNLTNVEEVQPTEPASFAQNKTYASVSAFCADLGVSYEYGARYRALNMEESHFGKGGTSAALNRAEHVRAIVRHSMPYIANAAVVQAAANEYYGNETVKGLTNGELASAIQAAVWYYANGATYGSYNEPYLWTADFSSSVNSVYWPSFAHFVSTTDPLNVYELHTNNSETNVNKVYQYLINLPGEKANDIIITQNALSLEKAILSGSGDNCTLELFVDINGTVDGDDELVLSAKCGDRTQTLALGKEGAAATAEGLFPITLTGVSMADCSNVDLELTGKQTVNDAVFFEAEPIGSQSARYSSQGFTGYGAMGVPVEGKTTVNPIANATALEITKVDAKSGNPLSGVAFDLYRKAEGEDLLIGSYVTDANGKISVYITDAEEFYFVETEALAGYAPIDGKLEAGEVPNSWNAGALQVSKKLINTTPAQVGETFNFKLKLDLSTAPVMGNNLSWMTEAYIMGQLECSKELTWTVSGENELTATFTLNADETVTVDSIPLGAAYTLEEVMTEEDRQRFTVTSKVDDGSDKKSNTASGTVAENNAVLFTNSVVTGPELKLGQLVVSKKLVNTTPAQVGETFNFQITLDFSTADVYQGGVPWMNGEYLLSKVSSSEDLTWTEKDGKYTATFTVDAEETVSFDGIAQGTTYTVEEVMTEEERQWFNVTSKVDDAAEKNSNLAQSLIAESNAVLFTNSVVTYDVALSKLAVSKKLINESPVQVGETFNFRITLDFSTADAYANAVPWMNDEYLMGFVSSSEDLNWTEKDGKFTATFTVDADETVTFEGLALGTTYTVEEILTEEDWQWFTVTSKVGNEPTQDSNLAQGSVARVNAVLFTNSVVTGVLKQGRLDVTKKLVNTTPAQVGDTFKFKITVDFASADIYTQAIPWLSDEYLLDFINTTQVLEWKEVNGKFEAIFTVKADETVSFRGLACGAAYTIEEVLSEEEQNRFESSAQVGGEAVGNVAQSKIAEQNTVVFTNSVVTTEVKLGSLEVSKKLVNTTPAKVGETFNFQITLDLSTADVHDEKVFWINDEYLLSLVTGSENLTWTEEDGKYTAAFTVDADETVTFDGIAQGAAYTVQEILTEEDRQWFTVTSQIGEEEVKASDTVTSTVAEKNAVIFTNSVVTGPELRVGKLEVSKKLVNASEAKAHERFTFQITLDLSAADVYQNPAPWMYDEYLLDGIESTQELTWTKSGKKLHTATFTLKADESIVLEGLPLGTGYTLEEVLSDSDRKLYKVTTSVTAEVGDALEAQASLVSNTVAQENAVIFTNEYVEEIPVTDDRALIAPVVLCLLAVMMTAVLSLNKRRFILILNKTI